MLINLCSYVRHMLIPPSVCGVGWILTQLALEFHRSCATDLLNFIGTDWDGAVNRYQADYLTYLWLNTPPLLSRLDVFESG